MANLETIELTISGSAEQAQQGINQLITSLGSLSEAITNPYNKLRVFNDELQRTARLTRQIKMPDLSTKTGASGAVSATKRNAPERYHPETKAVSQQEAMDLVASKQSDLVYMKAQGMLSEYIEKAQGGQLSFKQLAEGALQIKKTTDQFEKMVDAERKAKEEVQTFPSAFSKLKEGFSGLTKGLTGFFSKVKRIATTMLIRAAIRGLIKSIKEGVNNLYEWSKLNNGAFAKSLDTIKNKAGELKNSLGAAIAPVIQAAIPVIQSLMNAAIGAFNWVNQLISLLTGKSSWTKATEGVHDYTDATKKATGANKEWLASFDELNVMTSGGGGGGSGKTQVDYSDMFEEVYEFDEKIREISQFLKDNAQSIHDLAIATGLAIIEWKLAGAFAEALPLLATICGYLATAGAIAITLQIDWMLTNEYLKTGKEGWLFASVLTSAVGATAAWAIATKLIGTGAGYYAASITLAFTALTDIIAVLGNADVGAFSKESILTLVKAALMAGAAVGIMLKVFGGAAATPTLVASGAGAAALAVFGVAIGLKTSLDPNVKLFSKDHLIGTITSALLVGFGTFMFFGAVPAVIAAIVTAGVVIGIKAITQKDKIEVDSSLITLTEEQCKLYAKDKMFTIDPNIMVNVVKEQISVGENAEIQITEALSEMIGTVNVIHLGLANDNDYKEIKDQIIGEGGLIDKVNTWINSAEATSKLVLKITPSLVGETKEEQKQWYIANSSGWETVKGFMNDIGKQLTDEIVEGEKGELVIKRPERVAALLDEAARISEIIAGTDASTELNIQFSLELEKYDSSSIGQIITNFYDYKEKMKAAAEELRQTAYTNQARLVEAFKYMLTIDPNNSEIKQKLAEAEAGLEEIKSNWQEGIDKAIDEMTAPGRQILQEWINNNIFTEHEKGSIDFPVDFKVQLRMEEEISTKFQNLLQDEVDNAVDVMQYAFRTAGIDIPTEFIGDFLKFGGWDLLGEDLQRKIMSYVNITPKTIGKLKEKLGMDASQIIKFTNYNQLEQREQKEFITSLVSAYGSQSIDAIKKQLPSISATDILKVSDWNKFKTSQKIEFLTAITQAYGAEEIKSAARKCGIDIDAEIKKGLESNNDSVRKQAQELNKIIKTNVETPSPKPTVKVEEDRNQTSKTKSAILAFLGIFNPSVEAKENRSKTNEAKNGISATIGNFNPWVNATENKTATNNTKSSIVGSVGNIGSTVNVAVNSKSTAEARKTVVNDISGNPINVKVNATLNNQSALKSSVKGAFSGIKLSIKDNSGTQKQFATIAVAKTGGLFNSGDIFVANEDGTGEMVGRFGNQTGVANQREIVAGIQKGVADANAEQNALLRRQNELLASILQKDSSVRIGASAALGRTVRQSLDMYGALVGG